jgi:hypothetical protein
MDYKVFMKYTIQLTKLVNKSTIISLIKSPNICENFKERFTKFCLVLEEYKNKKVTDQKKCVKIAKKLESSPEYIDLLENCLVHKVKEIHKIYKNYPKTVKKIITVMINIIKYLTGKLKKLKKEDGNKEKIKKATKSLDKMNEQIKNIIKQNEKLKIFLKTNKKELDELKKNNIRAYITFFVIRYTTGCFVLPQSEI